VLFQNCRDAEALDSIATSLPEIWRRARAAVNHISIQQRRFFVARAKPAQQKIITFLGLPSFLLAVDEQEDFDFLRSEMK
jgi:hypothetical protein